MIKVDESGMPNCPIIVFSLKPWKRYHTFVVVVVILVSAFSIIYGRDRRWNLFFANSLLARMRRLVISDSGRQKLANSQTFRVDTPSVFH